MESIHIHGASTGKVADQAEIWRIMFQHRASIEKCDWKGKKQRFFVASLEPVKRRLLIISSQKLKKQSKEGSRVCYFRRMDPQLPLHATLRILVENVQQLQQKLARATDNIASKWVWCGCTERFGVRSTDFTFKPRKVGKPKTFSRKGSITTWAVQMNNFLWNMDDDASLL